MAKLIKSVIDQPESKSGDAITFDTLADDSYKALTGLTKAEFDFMLAALPLRTGSEFSKRDSLGIYLLRMRTGNPLC